MKHLIKLSLSASIIFAASVAVQAQNIIPSPGLSLRSGPGFHYEKSQKIAANTSVQIGVCNSAWCHVSANGRSGWVETATLSPALARQMQNRTATGLMASAGGGGVSKAQGRRQATATMRVSVRIVPKTAAGRSNTSKLPFPVAPERQVRSVR